MHARTEKTSTSSVNLNSDGEPISISFLLLLQVLTGLRERDKYYYFLRLGEVLELHVGVRSPNVSVLLVGCFVTFCRTC